VTRRVRPGHEVFYEQFLAGIISAASEFPGHLGVEVLRPQSATAGEYRTEEHAAWLERAEPHVIGPMRTSFVTGHRP
jgi:antibiotic biosynthesis monooxygenase (ABM) superfamily enzyme